jgi:hypothetical protein
MQLPIGHDHSADCYVVVCETLTDGKSLMVPKPIEARGGWAAGFCWACGWYVIERAFCRRRVPVKGDRVEIVVDTGDGARTYEVSATRAGRRVDVSTVRGVVEVTEVTRTGTAVRTARFMASRIIALVEHPADTSTAG